MDTKESINRLADFSSEIRKLTLKRLEEVPDGYINWRLNNTAMSFAHIVQHLIDVDELFFSLVTSKEKPFQWELGTEKPHIHVNKTTYKTLIEKLKRFQTERRKIISSFDTSQMNNLTIKMDGEKMTFWWFIMRKVLEHETYHRGQIAAYLKVLKGESS